MTEKRKRIWLTPEQQKAAAERYAANESIHTIAASFGVSTNNIYNAVRRQGGQVRGMSEAKTKFSHRQDAFDTITPESAYWIGFLFADGWINHTPSGPILHLVLAKKDCGHLFKFRDFLQSGHAIRDFKSSDKVRFGDRKVEPKPMTQYALRSTPLCEALMGHGMCVKSLERVANAALAENRDFWRGVVDGDGYLSERSDRKGQPRLGVCGGLVLMQQFSAFMRKNGIEHDLTVQCEKTLFKLEMSCGTAEKTVRLLYENAAVALDRKLADAQDIMKKH